MRLWLAAVTLTAVAACQPWDAPNEKASRTVEGCDDAVKHLRACCPRYDSYLSCTYLTNAVPSPDLTASESRCLVKRPCAEIERAVAAGDRVCGFLPVTKACR
ncbi:MAG TPA: hypothetical protein VF945_03990 [Polyangia bacterium]